MLARETVGEHHNQEIHCCGTAEERGKTTFRLRRNAEGRERSDEEKRAQGGV